MGLERNHKMTVGMESAYGDGGATPTAVPVFYEDARPAIDIQKFENPAYGGSLGRSKMFFGKKFYTLPAKFYLKTSGTAGTVSELGKLLRACGLQETINAGVSVVYSPRNTGMESVGLTVNLDGVDYVVKGTRGESLKIPLEAGNPVICEAAFKGLYTAPTVVALSAPTFADAAVTPPVVENMALTIGGATFVLRKLTLELKNLLGIRDSINAANGGVQQIDVIGREYGGSFTVEVDASNDIEFWTSLIGATEMAVASTGFGAVGNRIAIATSTMQLEEVKPAVDQGVTVYEVTFRINKHATAASELSITMT